MANYYYVKSGLGTRTTDTSFTAAETGAFGSGNLTAANCYASIGAIATFAGDGDFVFVSDVHNASYDNTTSPVLGDTTYTGQGLTIISVDDGNVALYSAGASDALSDNFDVYKFQGNGNVWGVTLYTSVRTLYSNGYGVWSFNDCVIKTSSGTGASFATMYKDASTFIFNNVDFNMTGNATSYVFYIRNASFVILNDCTITGASVTGDLINYQGDGGGSFRATGCDFSALTGDMIVTLVAGSSDFIETKLRKCLLNSGVSIPASGTELDAATQHTFLMTECDDSTGDAMHRFYYADGAGLVKNNDSVYTSSMTGWHDATADKSSLKVETSSLCSKQMPFEFSMIEQFIDLTDTASDTITLNLVTDATLTDTDLVAYATYQTSASPATPVTSFAGTGGDKCINPLAAGTTLATSSLGAADWTGEPASPNFYKIDIDASTVAGAKCTVVIRIMLYKDITTAGDVLYIDPVLGLS